jgi:hypothetical protein
MVVEILFVFVENAFFDISVNDKKIAADSPTRAV